MTGSPEARPWGFSTLGGPGLDLDALRTLVQVSGAGCVELRVAPGEPIEPGTSLSTAADIGAQLRAAGLRLLSLTSYVALADPDPAQDSALAAHLELAEAAGAEGVRVFMEAPSGTQDEEAERVAIARLARHQGGVPVLIETHDTHPTAVSLLSILAAGGARVIWDTAHTWSAGEDLADSARLLAPHLAYAQVKDVATRDEPVPVPLGQGAFPIAELVGALTSIGFGGPVSLEWERTWHPTLPPLRQALSDLGRWGRPLLEARNR